MFKKLTLSAIAALCLSTGAAAAAESAHEIHDYNFSFEGPFGTYDEHQLQRGLQVYTEVCSACHGLKFVPYRSLSEEGGPNLPEEQVRAYAAMYEVFDPELDDTRPAVPTDHFGESSLPNAPDLSLMAKARAGFHGPYGTGISQFLNGIGGPEYITNILTTYTGEDQEQAGTILHGNETFPGGWIAMAQPLVDGQVEFADGAPNDVESMSQDVAAFLMWTAEPKMMARKQVGLQAVLFLTLFAVLMYLTNKRLWAPVKGKGKDMPAE